MRVPPPRALGGDLQEESALNSLADTRIPAEYHLFEDTPLCPPDAEPSEVQFMGPGRWRRVVFPPLNTPTAGRAEVRQLEDVLERMLEALPTQEDQEQENQDDHVPRLALRRLRAELNVYSVGVHEIARQQLCECAERGNLLAVLGERCAALYAHIEPLFDELTAQLAGKLAAVQAQAERREAELEARVAELQRARERDASQSAHAAKAQTQLLADWKEDVEVFALRKQELAQQFEAHLKARQEADEYRARESALHDVIADLKLQLAQERALLLETQERVLRLTQEKADATEEAREAAAAETAEAIEGLEKELRDQQMYGAKVHAELRAARQEARELEDAVAAAKREAADARNERHASAGDEAAVPALTVGLLTHDNLAALQTFDENTEASPDQLELELGESEDDSGESWDSASVSSAASSTSPSRKAAGRKGKSRRGKSRKGKSRKGKGKGKRRGSGNLRDRLMAHMSRGRRNSGVHNNLLGGGGSATKFLSGVTNQSFLEKVGWGVVRDLAPAAVPEAAPAAPEDEPEPEEEPQVEQLSEEDQLVRDVNEVLDFKQRLDEAADVQRRERMHLSEVLYLFLLRKHRGDKSAANSAGRQLLDRTLQWRQSNDLVDCFSMFLESDKSTYPTPSSSLAFFLYARAALQQVPFGHSYDGPFVCLFKTRVLNQCIYRVFRFELSPAGLDDEYVNRHDPSWSPPGKRGGHAKRQHSLTADAKGAAEPASLLALKRRAWAPMTLDQLNARVEAMAVAGRPDGERKVPVDRYLKLLVDLYGTHAQWRIELLRRKFTSMCKRRLNKVQQQRLVPGREHLPVNDVDAFLQSYDPSLPTTDRQRVVALAAGLSPTHGDVFFSDLMAVANELRVFDDDFAALPSFADQYIVPVDVVDAAFDAVGRRWGRFAGIVERMLTAQRNDAVRELLVVHSTSLSAAIADRWSCVTAMRRYRRLLHVCLAVAAAPPPHGGPLDEVAATLSGAELDGLEGLLARMTAAGDGEGGGREFADSDAALRDALERAAGPEWEPIGADRLLAAIAANAASGPGVSSEDNDEVAVDSRRGSTVRSAGSRRRSSAAVPGGKRRPSSASSVGSARSGRSVRSK